MGIHCKQHSMSSVVGQYYELTQCKKMSCMETFKIAFLCWYMYLYLYLKHGFGKKEIVEKKMLFFYTETRKSIVDLNFEKDYYYFLLICSS